MYLRGLKQLDPSSIVSSIMGMALRSGGGASPVPALESAGGVRVYTTTQTTVSPQISPNFIQQSNPSNSPVGAATVQSSPAPQSASAGMPTAASAPTQGVPVTGAIPGMDTASGYLPTGTPLYPATPAAGLSTQTGLLAAAGILGLALVLRRKKGGAMFGTRRHSRSRSKK